MAGYAYMSPIALILPIALLALFRRGGARSSGGVADPIALKSAAQEAKLRGDNKRAALLEQQAAAAFAIVNADAVLT